MPFANGISLEGTSALPFLFDLDLLGRECFSGCSRDVF